MTYDYHIILSRDGIPFKEIRYSYEHTPAVPFASPTVFEIPASQVPSGAGPVTMWAELTGTVYNRVYTETLHATIDTTKPDDTKYPGDSPPRYPSMANWRTSVNVRRYPWSLYQPANQ